MASEIQKLQNRLANKRRQETAAEQELVRKTVIALSSAGMGLADRKGLRVEIYGVPTKLIGVGIATVGQLMSRGSVSRAFGAAADAALAVYSYHGVATGSFVAGITEVGASGDGGGL